MHGVPPRQWEVYLWSLTRLLQCNGKRMLTIAPSVGLRSQSALITLCLSSMAQLLGCSMKTQVSTSPLLPFLVRRAHVWAHHCIQQDIQFYLLFYVCLYMCVHICLGIEILQNVECIPIIKKE